MSRASAIMVPNLMMGQKQNGPDGSRQIAARERHPGVDDAVDAMDASAAAATAAAEAAAVAAAVSGTGDEPQTARKAAAAKADAGKHFKFFGFDQKTDNNIRIVSHLHTTSQYTRKEVPHTDLDAYLTVVARNRNQPPSPGLGPTSGSGAGLGSHQGATPAEDTKRIFPVHWLAIYGLDVRVMATLQKHFQLDPREVNDVLSTDQIPSSDGFDNNLFFIFRLHGLPDEDQIVLLDEQVSVIFMYNINTVITVHQSSRLDPCFDRIRAKLMHEKSRVRASHDASFMVYAFIDAAVDYLFPVVEVYAGRLDAINRDMHDFEPTQEHINESAVIQEQERNIRKNLWRVRELLTELRQDEYNCISAETKKYLQDVYKHTENMMEIVISQFETCNTLLSLFNNHQNNKLNDTLSALTNLSMLILPAQFFCGVYGMNFDYMPELRYEWAYFIFWVGVVVIMSITSGILWWKGRPKKRPKRGDGDRSIWERNPTLMKQGSTSRLKQYNDTRQGDVTIVAKTKDKEESGGRPKIKRGSFSKRFSLRNLGAEPETEEKGGREGAKFAASSPKNKPATAAEAKLAAAQHKSVRHKIAGPEAGPAGAIPAGSAAAGKPAPAKSSMYRSTTVVPHGHAATRSASHGDLPAAGAASAASTAVSAAPGSAGSARSGSGSGSADLTGDSGALRDSKEQDLPPRASSASRSRIAIQSPASSAAGPGSSGSGGPLHLSPAAASSEMVVITRAMTVGAAPASHPSPHNPASPHGSLAASSAAAALVSGGSHLPPRHENKSLFAAPHSDSISGTGSGGSGGLVVVGGHAGSHGHGQPLTRAVSGQGGSGPKAALYEMDSAAASTAAALPGQLRGKRHSQSRSSSSEQAGSEQMASVSASTGSGGAVAVTMARDDARAFNFNA